jgi:hypothetical protein
MHQRRAEKNNVNRRLALQPVSPENPLCQAGCNFGRNDVGTGGGIEFEANGIDERWVELAATMTTVAGVSGASAFNLRAVEDKAGGMVVAATT